MYIDIIYFISTSSTLREIYGIFMIIVVVIMIDLDLQMPNGNPHGVGAVPGGRVRRLLLLVVPDPPSTSSLQ